MEPKSYLSPKEFSLHSGLSLVTVRRYMRSGRLPSVQIGGRRHRILIPFDALEQVRPNSDSRPRPAGERPNEPTTPAPLSGPTPRWLRDRTP